MRPFVEGARRKIVIVQPEAVGSLLRNAREGKSLTVPEISRSTRIPVRSLEALELGTYESLPGEVFVKGFLRSYAQAVGLSPEDVVTRYTTSRAPVPPQPLVVQPVTSTSEPRGRMGLAVAFVLLFILFTLALSIVLKPRGRDLPPELSSVDARTEIQAASI